MLLEDLVFGFQPLAASPFEKTITEYTRRADMFAAVDEYAFGVLPRGALRFTATKVVVQHDDPDEDPMLLAIRAALVNRAPIELVDSERLRDIPAGDLHGYSRISFEQGATPIFGEGAAFRVLKSLQALDCPLSLLTQLGVTLCGGALFAALKSRDVLTPGDFHASGVDLDLFVTSSHMSRAERVSAVREHVSHSDVILYVQHTANGFTDDFVFGYQNPDAPVRTRNLGWARLRGNYAPSPLDLKVKVQIVSPGLLVSGPEVLQSFDISVCKLMLCNATARLLMTEDAAFCFEHRVLLYLRGMSGDPRYPQRFVKYKKRLPGFDVAVDAAAECAATFAARLLDSLRLKIGTTRCDACKRAINKLLTTWSKELPPCDTTVFVSVMLELEYASPPLANTYAAVQEEDVQIDVRPLTGLCGRANVSALGLQADPLTDLYAMYLAIKINDDVGSFVARRGVRVPGTRRRPGGRADHGPRLPDRPADVRRAP